MMSAASTDSAHGLMTDIRKVDSVVSTARRLLSEGQVVDLSALAGTIKDTCSATV